MLGDPARDPEQPSSIRGPPSSSSWRQDPASNPPAPPSSSPHVGIGGPLPSSSQQRMQPTLLQHPPEAVPVNVGGCFWPAVSNSAARGPQQQTYF